LSTVATTSRIAPDAGTYRIDPDASAVRFETTAVFGLAGVEGTFAVERGAVVVDPSGVVGAEAVVRAASVDTGNAMRDRHVRSGDYLNVAEHPAIHFRSRRIEHEGGAWTIEGDVAVRGVTRPVVLTGMAAEEAGRTTVIATTRIDRFAFGVTKGRGMTGRHLDLTVVVVARRAA
jgi:polyisoprenoid-binding protein YceI